MKMNRITHLNESKEKVLKNIQLATSVINITSAEKSKSRKIIQNCCSQNNNRKKKKQMKRNTATKVIIKTESKENEFVTKCLKATHFFNEPFRLSNEDYIQTDVKSNDMLQKLLFTKYKYCYVQFSKCVI